MGVNYFLENIKEKKDRDLRNEVKEGVMNQLK